ncbi:putative mitochondrial F1F0 ATP synthase subunit Atp14 [Viridothelium virens]|uniref:Putative mitochondrial F1F0 ATP synthase subunit Atp14 n=1 Tax=Viridothelium virens TaxID=1048519 RepID=A0A6A6HFP1_VIRVR|nr:putative mitochondrial F1F0 ATP synthase subunit Atp14 [Viridothelium virens]
MLSIRTSRLALARVARQHHALSRRSLIIPTAIRQADLVQDMYLRELKSYKPTPIKASDAEGHVQKFVAPKPPQSPEESDIAKDLQAYEQQQVEIEGQANTSSGAPAVEQDWLEEEEEDEAAQAHH